MQRNVPDAESSRCVYAVTLPVNALQQNRNLLFQMDDTHFSRVDGLWVNSVPKEEQVENSKREGGAGALDPEALLTGRTGSLESLQSQLSLTSPAPTPWGSTVSLSNSSVNLGQSTSAQGPESESSAATGWTRAVSVQNAGGMAPHPDGLGSCFPGSGFGRHVDVPPEARGPVRVTSYSSYNFGPVPRSSLGASALPTTYEDSVPSYLFRDDDGMRAPELWPAEDNRDIWSETRDIGSHLTLGVSGPRWAEPWNHRPFLTSLKSASSSGMAPLPPRRCASFAALPSDGAAPVATSLSANAARLVLEELRQERILLENMKERVPRVWLLLCAEIHRVQEILRQCCATSTSEESLAPGRSVANSVPDGMRPLSSQGQGMSSSGNSQFSLACSSSGSLNSDGNASLAATQARGDAMGSAAGLPSDPTLKDATEGGSLTRPGPIGGPQSDAAAFPNALPQGTGTKMSARNIVKKRCRVSVPADQYPDYNFVGRLLGPRGATLKKLEKETGCKIMIRGKGSIRKDKENEVRGKPGWEHVFSEPLHVILEAEMEESQADYALERAKELVELLLIPVPEDRDTLKREQLRELAMLNGTLRQSATEHEIPTGASPMSGSAGTQGSDAQSGTQAGRRSRRSLSGAGGSFSGSRPGTITTASAEASLTNSEYRIFGMTGSLGNMRLADMNS